MEQEKIILFSFLIIIHYELIMNRLGPTRHQYRMIKDQT